MNLLDLLLKALGQVWTTLLHNWPFLVISICLAAAMQLYVNKDAVAGLLRRYQKGGVLVATAAAVTTPLCSCGTTAVILGMMAGTAAGMPWAPIIAFMVASPLTSPEELVYSAGLFGWPFAIAFFVASIVLGLMGGVIGGVFDARGWLRNQARFAPAQAACACGTASPAPRAGKAARQAARRLPAPQVAAASAAPAAISLLLPVSETCGCTAAAAGGVLAGGAAGGGSCACETAARPLPVFVVAPDACGCELPAGPAAGGRADCGCEGTTVSSIAFMPADASMPAASAGCGCGSTGAGVAADQPAAARPRFDARAFLGAVAVSGRRLLVMFLAFATIGYLINDLIPSSWVVSLFGSGHAYSVPLAATLGLPFYINTEASLPLVRAMLDAGMSSGAALAFLITGAGTSIGAVAGAMAIARWRVIAIVIGTLWVGAILCGLAYDALLAAALF